jgi:hypothetical protein
MTAAAEDHPGRRSRATEIMLPGAWPFHDPLEDVEKVRRIAETIWQQILEIDLEIFGMKNP